MMENDDLQKKSCGTNIENELEKSYKNMDVQERSWQDIATGSMGSQFIMNDEVKDDVTGNHSCNINKYGQSREEMDKIIKDEKMIRNGYEEERSPENPGTKQLYEAHQEPGQPNPREENEKKEQEPVLKNNENKCSKS